MHYIEQQISIDARNYRTVRYDMERSGDIARYIAREHYAWPGGYELAAVLRDGELLCFDCCRSEYPQIARADSRSDWRAIGYTSTADMDDAETCAHCGRQIGGE